jgi:hypothetical protein
VTSLYMSIANERFWPPLPTTGRVILLLERGWYEASSLFEVIHDVGHTSLE